MQHEAASNSEAESRYQLLEVLAHGGQGAVWRALDQVSGHEVALKLLSGAGAQNADAVERLRRERAALVALNGTCAVRVIEGPDTHGGAPCVAMELLDGIDLESRLSALEQRGTRLGFPEVTQVIEPIVQTLHRAHGLGIVHRDLKPANIFLLRDGGVRLIDFGFARLEFESRMTQFGTIMGSPCYIAPEVWQGHANVSSVSVDIYSLAVIIYRMLGGHPPFETKSLVDMCALATGAPRPSLLQLCPDLPEDVDGWVRQALAVDPSDRYASVRAMWEALCEIVHQPKPSSWSIIPRAVAAGLHPKRVAEALRRAGVVLWGKSGRDSEPGLSQAPAADGTTQQTRTPRPKPPRPLVPPQRARLDDVAPVSEPVPISAIPLSSVPLSTPGARVSRVHASTTANIRERSKRRKKSKRRRANKQMRKARQTRRKARGKA